MNHDVRALFHELVDLSPDERERVLADRQIGPEVREEIVSLLSFDSNKIQALTDCVANAAEQVLGSAKGRELGSCGPYRLVRLLGSGGMGTVYLAERTDGEIQQMVAIKLLRADASRPAWRDRFLRERQLLASLNHPSIVHVMDAGRTDDGRPYLVMEYVDGTPIDVYAAGVEVRERLALFLRVCAAVSYAHRHLIIHRDLKPSNILVDGSGQPKLLDFGIAKLLDETGDATQTIERLFTPNYSSPEQLSGTIQTTATDVYSLGAVLYKLLTGRSPNESEAGAAQAIDAITGAKEITAPSRLNPSLPTDLDYILRKALRKEPEERYASVEAFANDIRAFLESKPVQARSGDAWYRTRKLLRRYRVPVVAAILVIASLSTGLYVANRERAIAQRRFADVRQLANKLFDIDVLARALPGSTKTRQLIVDTSLEYLQRLAADVRGDPELALEIGNAYMRVAQVQGVPIASNLGQIDEADKNLRVADGLIHSVLVSQPGNRMALLRAAEVARDRMILADINGHSDESNAFARESVAFLEKFNAQANDQPEASAILLTYLNVAQIYEHAGQADDALLLCQHGSDLARIFDRSSRRATFLQVAARIFQSRGDLDKALNSIQESASVLEPGPGNTDQAQTMNYVMSLVYQGEILGGDNAISLGRTEEAVAVLEQAFKIADDRVHQDPNDENTRGKLEMAGYPLASILRHSDAPRALAVYDHTLQHLAQIKSNPNVQFYQARAMAGSSYPLQELGNSSEARQRLEGAFKLLLQLKMYPAAEIGLGTGAHRAVAAQADYEASTGNIARALQLYQELLDRTEASKPGPESSLEDALDRSGIYTGMAAVHRQAGHPDLASALDSRRMELWRHWDSKLPNNPFVRRQLDAARLP